MPNQNYYYILYVITLKYFPWNQLFSKNVDFTEKDVDFSVKIVIAFYSIFPRYTYMYYSNIWFHKKHFVKSITYLCINFFFGAEILETKPYLLTVWKRTIKRDHVQNFPWNQLFSNLLSKNVDLTKKCWFFRKNRDRFYSTFPPQYTVLL